MEFMTESDRHIFISLTEGMKHIRLKNYFSMGKPQSFFIKHYYQLWRMAWYMIVIKAQAKKIIFRLSVDLCLINVNLGYFRIITNLITDAV